MSRFKYSCPDCGSTAVASRESIYRGGTSTYSGRHSSSGMSFGFGRNFRPRLFFGSGRHSGSRSSLLADAAAPMSVLPSLTIIVLILLFGGAGSLWFVILLCGGWAVYAVYYNSTVYSREWMCRNCQCQFVPEESVLRRISELCKEIPQELIEITRLKSAPTKRKVHEVKVQKLIQELKELHDNDFDGLPDELQQQVNNLLKSAPIEDINKVHRIEDLLPNVSTGEDSRRRKRDAHEVKKLLVEIEVSGNTELIGNFEELKNRITIFLKVIDASNLLDKADKEKILHDKKKEAKYLLEALYLLKKNATTVKEFDSLELKSEVTNELWTVAYIKQRLAAAGYRPVKKS